MGARQMPWSERAIEMLTQEHGELKRTIERFIDIEINPHVEAWEEAELYPAHEVFAKLGRLGALGLTKPSAYGGQELDYSYAMVLAEALGRIDCGAVPMSIGVQTDMATPALARHGSEALCREFLSPAIRGEVVSAIGVSEAGAGSDVASIKTHARVDGDDYVINGSKMWITNGIQADWICLLVNTSPDGGPHRNKTLVIVPLDTKGVSRPRKLKKLGMWASDTAQIFFEDVRVPRRNRIGAEGQGFTYQMGQFQEERLWAAANKGGVMERVIGATIAYTRERQAFGKSILDNQAVQFRLAELMTEVEALRALTWKAGAMLIAGEDVTRLASMAKLKAGRLMREVTDSCLQYWGGTGFLWESPVARAYRDGRLTSIGGGADEIMLTLIARTSGLVSGR